MFTFTFQTWDNAPLLDVTILSAITEWILKANSKNQQGIISLSILGDEHMQSLNKEYRWKDASTDILSFSYFRDGELVSEHDVFWELFLSSSIVESQAKEHWHAIEEEFYRLILHGILHLEWYDHENDADYESMNHIEQSVIKELQKKFGILTQEI